MWIHIVGVKYQVNWCLSRCKYQRYIPLLRTCIIHASHLRWVCVHIHLQFTYYIVLLEGWACRMRGN
jgi:hypothetical protein